MKRTLVSGLGLPLILLVSSVAVGQPAVPEDADQRAFSFAIVPQQAPSKLLRSWGPLLRYLQVKTGYRFLFRTAPDIPTFEDRLAAGEYDFAYMNPYHFTIFNRGDEGYQAVAKAAAKRIRGIVVVRKDSPINTLAELDGSDLAFPAPAAFAASVLPRANLDAQAIRFRPNYVSSHDSVYRTVAEGLFVAGGGVVRTLEATDPTVSEQLRVLWTTPSYTPHAIAANSEIDVEVVNAVQEALLAMASDATGVEALVPLKVEGFEPANNADWDDIRSLNIKTDLGQRN